MEFVSTDQARGYLAAMIDGEGCVEYKKLPSGTWRRRVRISNTSQGVIAAIRAAANVLGVPCTVHARKGTNKPAWEVNFPGHSIVALAQNVSLADEGKRDRLASASRYRATLLRDPTTGRITGYEVVA